MKLVESEVISRRNQAIPGDGNSVYKGPEARGNMVFLRSRKKVKEI